MDSLQLSELQTFIHNNKGELGSKKLFVESVECASLYDLQQLDPVLERTLDLGEYMASSSSSSSNNNNNNFNCNFSCAISSDCPDQSLPQVVLDATAVVHQERYPGEGSVIPHPVVNFLDPAQSPEQSDITSYYSDDSSSSQPMPEFSQLTSPSAEAPATSFPWPNLHVKSEDFGLPSSQASVSGVSDGALPYNITSPTTSIPTSPASTIYSVSSPGTPGPSAPTRGRRPHNSTAPYSTKSRRRQVEKGTVEYVEKRARNNVAVRKSRAKAKEKQKETESRVKCLQDHNDQLQKKVDLLTKELNVLKGLFLNVGASIPDDFLKLIGDS